MNCKFIPFSFSVKIILLVAFIYGGLLHSQVLVRGVIMSNDSSTVIDNAYILNLSAKTGTLSNDSGFYKIIANTGDRLEFGKTGFVSKRIVFKGETVLNITLSVSENLLDEIVVSASKGDQSLKNTSVSIEAIKPYIIASKRAKELGLGVNAGHDLSCKIV